MAELIIQIPDRPSWRHRLLNTPQTIGRDAGCEIPVDDPSASRRHARFTPTADGFVLEDLGSKNGTLVNDAPCTSHVLQDGDRILIGSVLAVFQDQAQPSAPAVVISEDGGTTHATRYATRDTRLVLPQQRLQMIYELSERLTTLQSQDALLNSAVTICFEMLQFERGAIGIRRKGQRTVDWPVVRNLRGAEGELTISRTLLNRALEYGERAIFTGGETANADPTMSIVQHGIRSAMCVPLIHDQQILGVIYGDRLTTRTVYTQEDIDFLAGIARQISIGLVNWQLLEEQQQMIRLNHDIDVARNIQTGLFPKTLPNHDRFKVAAINDPGQRVSGDYYDVIELPDGRLWCLMADVTGEGVAAAILMANFQAMVRATIDETDDPGRLMTKWNHLICKNTSSAKFITCLLALIDGNSKSVRVANAGHHPPLIVTSGKACKSLECEPSLPLGVSEHETVLTHEISLGGEPLVFFCYTDGVIEAMNSEGNAFGTPSLESSLSNISELNPLAMVKQVRKAVATFAGGAPQSDDITILAARVS